MHTLIGAPKHTQSDRWLKVGRLHPFLHGYESSVAINVLGQQLPQLLSKTLLSDERPAGQSMGVSYSWEA